ncbi:MAG: DNA-binding/iron metalloprotein/AP endonuclease [Fimbriimonadales bacterium]|nr:MAG: DNA-binding/iron metalloprotein/AP endonuclease [Fimbriimonadales bacterium]
MIEYWDGPVLGIETSCDETSVGIVEGKRVLANVVSSQAQLHRKWGGIVPEEAARKHTEAILPVLETALEQAGLTLDQITGIGVTNRPGLVGALSVGVSCAKALTYALEVPLVGVHHLEAHVLSTWIEHEPVFPNVCLLVSGGHTELFYVSEPGEYEFLGGTLDDAAGEAFDKSARALGLGYPGGPAIQKAAEGADPTRYDLPRGLSDPNLNFSFSGLKTAVLNLVRNEGAKLDVPSAAASFQETVASVLVDRAVYACEQTGARCLTVVGGVAANAALRRRLQEKADAQGLSVALPSLSLCTDNGAMIAHVASWRIARGERDGAEMRTVAVESLGRRMQEDGRREAKHQ